MRNIQLSSKQEQRMEQGSDALGTFFCIVLAAIVAIWLCHDTSAGLTASLHHAVHYTPQKASTGFWPLDVVLEWL